MSANPYDIEHKLPPQRANTPSLKYSQKSIEETAADLQTDIKLGLTNSQDVLNRRSIHGINELNGDEEGEPIVEIHFIILPRSFDFAFDWFCCD